MFIRFSESVQILFKNIFSKLRMVIFVDRNTCYYYQRLHTVTEQMSRICKLLLTYVLLKNVTSIVLKGTLVTRFYLFSEECVDNYIFPNSIEYNMFRVKLFR